MLRLLTVGLFACSAATAAAAAERYSNEKYGVSFDLPAAADVCRSTAPLPNHGLLFRPAGVTSPPCEDDIESGTRYTSVDARFDVDPRFAAADFARVECPELAYDSQGRVTAVLPDARPGRLRWFACCIDGKEGSVQLVLFARRRPKRSVPPIAYTITLKTTHADFRRDHAAFARWLNSVRIGRLL